jgi:hypothetical protein
MKKNTMKRNIILIGLFGFSVGLIWLFLWPRLQSTPLQTTPVNTTTTLPLPTQTNSSPILPLQASLTRIPAAENQQKAWTQFTKQFGTHLQPQFSEDGYLLSISREPSFKKNESFSVENFDTKNSIQGLNRAKEILAAAQELLHIQPDWPLENATIQNGPLSCQIYWTETHQGLPVLPGGAIKIDLGNKGELLELQSTYLHSIQIVNQVHLTQDEAESRVPGSGPIYGGNLIIWNTGNNQGHMAYQMSRNGRQIILDADTGKILMNRDRRQF